MTLLSVLWAIASGICPQRPSHSLFLGGRQMSIEACMAGMFGGFVIGAVYFWALGRGRAMRLPSQAMLGSPGLAILTRRENRAVRSTDVLPPAQGGLVIAAVLLVILSGIRYELFDLGPLQLPL